MQRTAFQAYNQAMHTVGKTRQVVMLYDGAIRYLQQARQAIEENRIEERYKLLVRVSEILMGLQSALDFENGGNIARILYDFYSSLDARLTKIQRTNSLSICDDVIEELKQMRGIWHDIDAQSADSSTAGQHDPLAPTESFVAPSANTQEQPINFLPSDFSA